MPYYHVDPNKKKQILTAKNLQLVIMLARDIAGGEAALIFMTHKNFVIGLADGKKRMMKIRFKNYLLSSQLSV